MRPLKLRIQAFGSYVEEQVLDFESALADAPFVLIHGATGAGKTTILDAIVFALYGESSGNVREGTTLRSATAPPERTTEVEYVFALGRRRYRILRSPTYERMSRGKMTRRPPTGQLYQLPSEGEDGDEVLLDSNVTEVSKRIGQLIGFDADQFRQVVLLPQGQFQRFLLAEVKDRSAIMQRIFRTERYQRIEDALLQESLKLERAANEERARIDQMLHGENLGSLEELRTRVTELNAVIDSHAAEIKALEEKQRTARRAREAGTTAQQKLQELADAQKRFGEKQAQEKSVADFRILLERAQRAQPVIYKELAAVQAAEQEKTRAGELKEAALRLTAAQTALHTAKEALTAAEEAEPERTKKTERIQLLSNYAERAQKLQDCRASAEKLRAHAKHLEEEKKTAADAIEKLTAECKENEERIAALEKILAGKEALQHEQDRLKCCQSAAARITALTAQESKLRTQQEEEQQTVKDASQQLAEAKTRLRQMQTLYDLGSAARLAETLADGAPCPVCGALSHPSPAMHAEDIPSEQEVESCAKAVDAAEQNAQNAALKLEEAKEKYARANQSRTQEQELLDELLGSDTIEGMAQRTEQHDAQLRHAEKEHTERTTQHSAQQAQLESMRAEQEKKTADAQKQRDLMRLREGEQAALETELPEEYRDYAKIAPEIQRLTEEVAQQKRAYDAAQEKEKEAAASNARAESTHAAAKRAHTESIQTAQTAQSEYAAARTQAGFSSEEEYHAAIAGNWADSEHLEKVQKRINAYETDYKTAAELLNTAKKAAEGLTPPDMAALMAAEAAADQAVRDQAREQGIRTEQRDALTRMMNEIDALEKAGAARAERYRVIGRLANVAAAKAPYQVHFQTYVLRSILSDVIEAANARLVVMSRGRYRLVHGEGGHRNKWWGLEIDVFDEYTGLPRVSRTLSGGETFLASLALALGLSDVVQHYAGGMHLDMIFIDEGFGSLDSETLDVAIRALLEVQQEGGRLVAIISHVEELRARIPVHLEVMRTANGSRARFTQGGAEAL